MAQLTVKVDDGRVKTVLGNAGLAVQNLPAKVVRPEMEQARDEVATYPAELPNQRYVRTGRRGEATKLVAAPGNNQYSSKYTLESNPSYPGGGTGNPYTIGDALGAGQAAIHQGRWVLLRTAVEKAVARIVEKGAEYFRAVLERNGAP